MLVRVLSLDISASSTGWAFAFGQARGQWELGTIVTDPKRSRAERLVFFRSSLATLLKALRPTHVVIEDVYSGPNVKTMALLAKFAGVAEECCASVAKVEPYIISTATVKSFFKVKNKRQMFDAMVELYDLDPEEVSFNKHNDITDAIGQLICYYDQILGVRNFRFERPYGFIYEV
jgi:Holliday junction resolvasome RuvABC endonuclease subunit